MIQRIQTLYLAVAIAALSGYLLSDLPSANGVEWQMYIAYSLGLSVIGLALVGIFKFKSREKQQTFITIALAEMVVFAAFIYGTLYFAGNLYFRSDAGMDAGRLAMLLMPVVAYVCLRLALASIKRDIRLVASADQLR